VVDGGGGKFLENHDTTSTKLQYVTTQNIAVRSHTNRAFAFLMQMRKFPSPFDTSQPLCRVRLFKTDVEQ
jgi:hypothetical protein